MDLDALVGSLYCLPSAKPKAAPKPKAKSAKKGAPSCPPKAKSAKSPPVAKGAPSCPSSGSHKDTFSAPDGKDFSLAPKPEKGTKGKGKTVKGKCGPAKGAPTKSAKGSSKGKAKGEKKKPVAKSDKSTHLHQPRPHDHPSPNSIVVQNLASFATPACLRRAFPDMVSAVVPQAGLGYVYFADAATAEKMAAANSVDGSKAGKSLLLAKGTTGEDRVCLHGRALNIALNRTQPQLGAAGRVAARERRKRAAEKQLQAEEAKKAAQRVNTRKTTEKRKRNRITYAEPCECAATRIHFRDVREGGIFKEKEDRDCSDVEEQKNGAQKSSSSTKAGGAPEEKRPKHIFAAGLRGIAAPLNRTLAVGDRVLLKIGRSELLDRRELCAARTSARVPKVARAAGLQPPKPVFPERVAAMLKKAMWDKVPDENAVDEAPADHDETADTIATPETELAKEETGDCSWEPRRAPACAAEDTLVASLRSSMRTRRPADKEAVIDGVEPTAHDSALQAFLDAHRAEYRMVRILAACKKENRVKVRSVGSDKMEETAVEYFSPFLVTAQELGTPVSS